MAESPCRRPTSNAFRYLPFASRVSPIEFSMSYVGAGCLAGAQGQEERKKSGTNQEERENREQRKQVRRQLTAAHALICYRCFLPDLAGFTGLRCAGPAPDQLDHSMAGGSLLLSQCDRNTLRSRLISTLASTLFPLGLRRSNENVCARPACVRRCSCRLETACSAACPLGVPQHACLS